MRNAFIEELVETHDASIVLTTHDLAEAERAPANEPRPIRFSFWAIEHQMDALPQWGRALPLTMMVEPGVTDAPSAGAVMVTLPAMGPGSVYVNVAAAVSPPVLTTVITIGPGGPGIIRNVSVVGLIKTTSLA